MKKITLKNNFHNSECRIIESVRPNRYTYASISRRLCGIKGCQCGIVRGPQDDGAEEYWLATQYERFGK